MQRHLIITSEKHRVIMRADCVGVCCRIFIPFRFTGAASLNAHNTSRLLCKCNICYLSDTTRACG